MPANDIGAIYTPAIFGRTSFPLRHQANRIFYKIFDASNSAVVDLTEDTIRVPEHYFKTGEKLTYRVGSGSSIGITTTSPGNVGLSTYLPTTVYPIVVNKDTIRVALASSLAYSNNYVNLNSLGIGSFHSFSAEKQNAKCLISIDNIIQAPLSVASTVGVTSYTNTSLTLDKLNNVKLGSFLKISSEIVKVSAINYSTNVISISRGSGIMGTPQITFTDSSALGIATVLSGNYNIVQDIIYFADPPLEGKRVNLVVPLSDINFELNSFNYFTNEIITGSQAVFYAENPPQEFENGGVYYLIRSSNNTFQFAESLFDAFNGNEIEFSTTTGNLFPVTGFQLFLVLPRENSSFQGRVFLKSNYDGNYVFDDVSEQFTGITSSFKLSTNGISTTGISTDNGIVLINNVFQFPEFDEAFEYRESGGETFIDFKGYGDSKPYDVNVKGLPRGGIIVSYGTSAGSLYSPLYPANGVAIVSAAGTVSSVLVGDKGSGYRSGISTYYVYFENAELPGSGGVGIATANIDGTINAVTIINGGSGYTYNGLSTSLTANINLLDPNGTPIGVGTTSIFEYFRGEQVSATNPGYVLIDNEIIKYTGIANSTSQLTGTVRGMLNTVGVAHTAGVSSVRKYEYNYIAKFDAPIPYDNVPLVGSATGIGASVRFKVENDGSISDLTFTNFGYNYKVGDILTPGGVLGVGTQTNNDKLRISVEEVAKDEFAAWNIGILKKLDDLTNKVNGVRKVFTLTETIDGKSRRTSFESTPGGEIDLNYNILVFVNEVLQVPYRSYKFNGGSQLVFDEAPPVGSDVKVYFYEGYFADTNVVQNVADVKEGDVLRIQRDFEETPPLGQINRTAKRIMSSDTLRTEVYSNVGLSEGSAQLRAISWTPQKADKIIAGEYISKSREEWSSGITTITKLTVNYNVGVVTVGIATTTASFTGVSTNVITLSTTAGIGSLIAVRDYIEGNYISIGTTVTSVSSGQIGISTIAVGISSGTNNTVLRFYRKN
jgi:hypothetical protein